MRRNWLIAAIVVGVAAIVIAAVLARTVGDDVKQQLDSSIDELSSQYEELKAGAQEALDADSTAEILGALAALVPQFQALMSEAQQLVQTIQSEDVAGDAKGELEEAFSEAESCQELQAETGSEG